MGNLASSEALALRWDEVCRDATLRNLPYKIELNAWGKIEMSPANNRHAVLQGAMAVEQRRGDRGQDQGVSCRGRPGSLDRGRSRIDPLFRHCGRAAVVVLPCFRIASSAAR
jgi:hypothetical protein